eukprot:COSAG05_NODE_1328_length_5166_cov_4.355634_2_plen_198_part_00
MVSVAATTDLLADLQVNWAHLGNFPPRSIELRNGVIRSNLSCGYATAGHPVSVCIENSVLDGYTSTDRSTCDVAGSSESILPHQPSAWASHEPCRISNRNLLAATFQYVLPPTCKRTQHEQNQLALLRARERKLGGAYPQQCNGYAYRVPSCCGRTVTGPVEKLLASAECCASSLSIPGTPPTSAAASSSDHGTPLP